MAIKLPGPPSPRPEPPPPAVIVLVNNTTSNLSFTVSGVPNQPFILFNSNNLPVSNEGISVPPNSFIEYYYYGTVSVTSSNNLGYWLTIP